MNNFSIVIPLYNEAQNIEQLVKEIFLSLEEYHDYEIIFVNDCSEDKTKNILEILQKRHSKIKTINNTKNLGQSHSIFNGIRKAKYKLIVTLDGDCQNNPKDIPSIVKKYNEYEDIFLVGGIRSKRKDTFIKIYSSYLANLIRQIILKDGCPDTGCSLKAFDRDIFLNFPFFDGIHRFLPALFLGFGKKTYFINVDHRPRLFGKSKYGTFLRLIRGIFDIIKVMKIINDQKKKQNKI